MLRLGSMCAILATVAAKPHYGGDHYGHSIEAPVKSYHTVHTVKEPSHIHREKVPVIDIHSSPLMLKMNFNSHSTKIHATQNHYGTPGHTQHASHVDDADVLVQNIKKPIIQQVHEVITPYRTRVTKVTPVNENVETLVPQSHGHHGGYGGGHSEHKSYHQQGHGYHKS